jgi:hypothetical protein
MKWLYRMLCVTALAVVTQVVWAGAFEEARDVYYAKDYKQAMTLLRPLAEQGHPEAQYLVGNMYERGDGVTKDINEAGKWYRLSADQKFARAEFKIGIGYAQGVGGVQKSTDEALKWITRAGCHGYKKAQKTLIAIYENGDIAVPPYYAGGEFGVKPDPELAAYWRARLQRDHR